MEYSPSIEGERLGVYGVEGRQVLECSRIGISAAERPFETCMMLHMVGNYSVSRND